MTKDIERKVADYINRHALFSSRDSILVALSGGADSVALLRILHTLGYRCEAAHCNFTLRGEESDRDELFVRRLCDMLQLPLHVTHFDTKGIAAARHVSVEMAARDLRYDWFEQLRLQTGTKAIAVAHHKDDSVETVLLNLIRGSGLNGLKGIQPLNGHVARPLLCLERKEIVEYLQEKGQDYMTDSTNLEDTFNRNKIRLNVLPLLESVNPMAKDHIWQTARRISEAIPLLRRAIEEGKRRVMSADNRRVDIKALCAEPSPKTLLFEILYPLGFNSSQIETIWSSLHGQSGKTIEAADWKAVRDRSCILLEPRNAGMQKPNLIIEEKDMANFTLVRDRHVACLDADRLKYPLTIRLWQHGDSFVPLGRQGRKKISDYLTDRKFSIIEKERQWVLCCGPDIVWIVDERIDHRFRVTPQTRRVTVVTHTDTKG